MESPYSSPQTTSSPVVNTEIVKNVKRIAPVRAGVVGAVTSALFVLIGVLIIMPLGLAGLFHSSSYYGPSSSEIGGGILMMLIVAPLIYGIIGFFGGLIWAWIYNIVAKWTGGIQITLDDPKH